MKFEELLDKERKEGESLGERRMIALMKALLQDNRTAEISALENDENLREKLYQEYGL